MEMCDTVIVISPHCKNTKGSTINHLGGMVLIFANAFFFFDALCSLSFSSACLRTIFFYLHHAPPPPDDSWSSPKFYVNLSISRHITASRFCEGSLQRKSLCSISHCTYTNIRTVVAREYLFILSQECVHLRLSLDCRQQIYQCLTLWNVTSIKLQRGTRTRARIYWFTRTSTWSHRSHKTGLQDIMHCKSSFWELVIGKTIFSHYHQGL